MKESQNNGMKNEKKGNRNGTKTTRGMKTENS